MISIVYTVLLFNVLIILFKLFEKYNVDNLQALIINYASCAILSSLLITTKFSLIEIAYKEWITHSLVLGSLFIIVFYIYAYAVQKIGIIISTLFSRMSLIIPIIAAVLFYENEYLTNLQIIALFLTIIGIVLTSKIKKEYKWTNKHIAIPILVFLGQGVVDSIFNDFTKKFSNHDPYLFFLVLFSTATITGCAIVLYIRKKEKKKLQLKNVYWGILFSIPNFFSLLTFINALKGIKSTIVFPVVCMGIIVTSSILGFICFKEKITLKNLIGISLCLISIYIFTYDVQ